jgi:hypothetical protein
LNTLEKHLTKLTEIEEIKKDLLSAVAKHKGNSYFGRKKIAKSLLPPPPPPLPAPSPGVPEEHILMGLAMFTAFDTVCLNIVPGAMVASS